MAVLLDNAGNALLDNAGEFLFDNEEGSDVSVSPSAGRLAAVVVAPTIAASSTVAPTTATLRFAGQQPSLAAHYTSQPGTGSLAVRGVAPTVSASVVTAPSAGTIRIAGQTPTVAASSVVSSAASILAISASQASVAAGAATMPDAGIVKVTGEAPTVAASFTAQPGAGIVAIAGQAPTVAAAVILEAAVATIAIEGIAPVASIIQRQQPNAVLASSGLQDTLSNVPPQRLADIDEAADADDAEWWTATDPSGDVSARVGFTTPAGVLYGMQTIRVLVRGASLPAMNVRVELWEDGAKLTSEVVETVTSDSGQIVVLQFPASEVTNSANVEVRVLSEAA